MRLKLPCFLLVKDRKKIWIWKNKKVVIGPKYGYVFLMGPKKDRQVLKRRGDYRVDLRYSVT